MVLRPLNLTGLLCKISRAIRGGALGRGSFLLARYSAAEIHHTRLEAPIAPSVYGGNAAAQYAQAKRALALRSDLLDQCRIVIRRS